MALLCQEYFWFIFSCAHLKHNRYAQPSPVLTYSFSFFGSLLHIAARLDAQIRRAPLRRYHLNWFRPTITAWRCHARLSCLLQPASKKSVAKFILQIPHQRHIIFQMHRN
jgi:hypothetical protein